MKLASFDVPTATGTARRLGVYADETDDLVDVNATYAQAIADDGESSPREVASAHAPTEMIDFLRRGDRAMNAAERALEYALETNAENGLDGAGSGTTPRKSPFSATSPDRTPSRTTW